MPAKSICGRCGKKCRSEAHVCFPEAVERWKRKKEILNKL